MRIESKIAIQIPSVLLPNAGIDHQKWAVIACDQFTSEPEYWENVETTVGESPSTLRMILPEVYLGMPDEEERIENTRVAMRKYLEADVFVEHNGLILVERTLLDTHNRGKTITRHGLIIALDLEQYDFNKGSQTLIRATEGTIIERLPPRMKIRKGAALEIPHILVLIDDPQQTVIEPLVEQKDSLVPLYDFNLHADSGHLTGYRVSLQTLEDQCVQALAHLASPETFYPKYGISRDDKGVLLFAMGDGNHSLATAKAIWEEIKTEVGMDHPARYALVEVENVHDRGLIFEPIHRILMHIHQDFHQALSAFYPNKVLFQQSSSFSEMVQMVNGFSEQNQHCVGLFSETGAELAIISDPHSNLPVGTIQNFLDHWKHQGQFDDIDYVHGTDVLQRLGVQPGNLGIFLPGMDKNELFRTVILDGSLPRKTFSMGEAREKRFYMECRRIS